MTLAEATSTFEKNFKSVTSKTVDRCEADLVCSGGVVKFDATLPALYSSANAAILAWLQTATLQCLASCVTLEWLSKPELLEFQITMADRIGQHRLVANRFAVKSQFQLGTQ